VALVLVASIVIPSFVALPLQISMTWNIEINGAEGESRLARLHGLSRRHLWNKVMLIATRSLCHPLNHCGDRVRALRAGASNPYNIINK